MESFVKIATWRTFRPKRKQLKHPTRKNSLHLEKWNFVALILKHFFNFLIIQEIKTPKKISYISGNESPKKLVIFLGNGTFKPKLEEISCTSGNKFPKKILKRKLVFIFRENETPKKFFIF